ncbi:MAG: hypothetical protein G01um101418_941 [Parcubacteria group bacterium Gr01-1014_18]|nr:MAG: hypothetical protein Greene041636_943 [Parcubacteria group bacterium Greene0416_36]TSC79680.1 MAG: hypothetical protein G01um101418_941 [Parcubacteria group bacterium Gr01-1014_18]TSC97872.1 MAG: hypothetical protein Greene101420_977 [Parcubacteria group bacterium Greene1014_20]TSD06496.1 MAG: hypothetical protein Greene07142_877 [Parcubacteria group bacterium Greene0714_2]
MSRDTVFFYFGVIHALEPRVHLYCDESWVKWVEIEPESKRNPLQPGMQIREFRHNGQGVSLWFVDDREPDGWIDIYVPDSWFGKSWDPLFFFRTRPEPLLLDILALFIGCDPKIIEISWRLWNPLAP